jgi:hypothetical protein
MEKRRICSVGVLDDVEQDAEDNRQEADQECGIRPEHKRTIYSQRERQLVSGRKSGDCLPYLAGPAFI